MPKKIVEAKVIGQHVLNNSTKLIEVTHLNWQNLPFRGSL